MTREVLLLIGLCFVTLVVYGLVIRSRRRTPLTPGQIEATRARLREQMRYTKPRNVPPPKRRA